MVRIGRGCQTASVAAKSGKKWFPYMKGGAFKRWYGNQELVVEWGDDGRVVKENTKHHYPQLGNNLGWKISNEAFYFRRGVTWSDLTSGRFSARLSPGGFIFDVKGSSGFAENVSFVLGILNTSLAHFALNLVNPTVSFQVGDLASVRRKKAHLSDWTGRGGGGKAAKMDGPAADGRVGTGERWVTARVACRGHDRARALAGRAAVVGVGGWLERGVSQAALRRDWAAGLSRRS